MSAGRRSLALVAAALTFGCAQKPTAPSGAGARGPSAAQPAPAASPSKKDKGSDPMPPWLLDEIEDSLAKGEPAVAESEWAKLIAAARAVKALPKDSTDEAITKAVTGAGFESLDDAAKSLRPASALIESFLRMAMSAQMVVAAHDAGPAGALLKNMADEGKAELRKTATEKGLTRRDLEFLFTHSEECGAVLAMRIALAMRGLYSQE